MKQTCSMMKGVLVMFLIMTDILNVTKQEQTARTFGVVDGVGIDSNIHLALNQVQTKMRCTSLCIQRGCKCTSFIFDNDTKTCYIVDKTLIKGTGNSVGYNKITECATPPQIAGATLKSYTGCTATYTCKFGYTSSTADDSTMITCQGDETWTPSNYKCLQKSCPEPTPLPGGHFVVSSYYAGGNVTYECNTGFFNIGGEANIISCELGGTWSRQTDMVCTPGITYTIIIYMGHGDEDGTDANVFLELDGAKSNKVYTKIYYDVRPLLQITIGHDNTGVKPDLKLEWITIVIDDQSFTWFPIPRITGAVTLKNE